ncbi:FitA-like ribbon-helix-helix domain-containing protein [Nitrococcus mobilis]|uniref:FitA-like ribbon-helix-helix domain-containing protein n=1 Tax=Nitrococcus mobilis TaxID=35797 RepID=UPI001E6453E5|nr:DNA-binding protein [Nitrococcus mobilis]
MVRNLDERIVAALQRRAAEHGWSAEAEHRALLEEILLRLRGRSFAEVIAEIPEVGEDRDFQRVAGETGADRVFD